MLAGRKARVRTATPEGLRTEHSVVTLQPLYDNEPALQVILNTLPSIIIILMLIWLIIITTQAYYAQVYNVGSIWRQLRVCIFYDVIESCQMNKSYHGMDIQQVIQPYIISTF